MARRSERVVVGVDGSDCGRAALAHALLEAARRDAAVEVVTVVTPADYWVPFYGRPTIPIDEIRAEVAKGTEQIVHEVIDGLGRELTRPPPVTVSVETGSAARALLARADDADLLVVGSRGRGALAGALLGSVGLSCALHATCPVTVVHGPRTGEPATALSRPVTGRT